MFEDNEQAIARISVINDEINRALADGPDITDIPDEAYEARELEALATANLALLQAVRMRHQTFEMVAEAVRKRLSQNM